MRILLLILSFCLLAAGAQAAQKKKLPDFFHESFDAVSAQPLSNYPLGSAEGATARADETGAIPAPGVPQPPPRPEDGVVLKKKVAKRLSPRQAPTVREQQAPPRIVASATPANSASDARPVGAGGGNEGAASTAPVLGAPFALKVPMSVRIRSGSSFMIDKQHYQLTDLGGVGVNTKCVPEPNGRCIRHPMRSLREAIAGRTLQCRTAMDGPSTRVTCTR